MVVHTQWHNRAMSIHFRYLLCYYWSTCLNRNLCCLRLSNIQKKSLVMRFSSVPCWVNGIREKQIFFLRERKADFFLRERKAELFWRKIRWEAYDEAHPCWWMPKKKASWWDFRWFHADTWSEWHQRKAETFWRKIRGKADDDFFLASLIFYFLRIRHRWWLMYGVDVDAAILAHISLGPSNNLNFGPETKAHPPE